MGEEWPSLGRLLWSTGPPARPIPRPRRGAAAAFLERDRLIESVSSVWPVASLLDDLQWADGSSLALVPTPRTAETRGAGPDPRQLSERRGRPPPPLEAALHDLDRQRLLERIQVAAWTNRPATR